MPNSVIYVDPSVTDAAAILVDGVNYSQIGPTAVPPDTLTIDGECSDCLSCVPAPCTCPFTTIETYTVDFLYNGAAGTFEVTNSTTDFCAFEGSPTSGPLVGTAFILAGNGGGPPPCGWALRVPAEVLAVKPTGPDPTGSYNVPPGSNITNIVAS